MQFPPEAIVGYKDEDGHFTYGLLQEWAEKLVAIYAAERGENVNKPENSWSTEELEQAMGLKKSAGARIIRNLREQLSTGQPYAEYLGIEIPSEAISRYMINNKPIAYSIQIEWGEKIAAAYRDKQSGGTETKVIFSRTADDLKAKPLEPRKSLARMTEEERAAAKRSSFGRGKAE